MRSRAVLVIVPVVLLAIGCQPIPRASTTFGNDVSACPQFQPTSAAPCAPQPLVWAAISGPYENHANGDPYATKCASETYGLQCHFAGYPYDASNLEYRPSGYTYAIDVGPRDVGRPLTLQGWDVGLFRRSVTANAVGVPLAGDASDCRRGVAPFDDASYYGEDSSSWKPGFGSAHCQTGDGGTTKSQNFDVQLFDNDGSNTTVSKAVPLPECHYRLLGTDEAYDATKNAWTPLCTFTPSQPGVYPFEVRNSGLSGVADRTTMTGWNTFALRVTGGAATRLHPLDDASIWINNVGPVSEIRLVEVTPDQAGRTLVVEMFDPVDGAGPAEFAVQIKGPGPAVPNGPPTGRVIPAAGVAGSCRANYTRLVRRADPAPTTLLPSCRRVTKPAGTNSSTYNDGWLRVEIAIDPAYTCGPAVGTDCWWTLEHQYGTGTTFPTDRMVYAWTFR